MNKKIFFLILIFIVIFGTSSTYFNFSLPPKKIDIVNSNIFSLLMGRYREFLSEFLWNRVDIYHHMWEFSGKSTSNENGSLYLLKFATVLNPHFVKAYALGSFILYKYNKKKKEGKEFLLEGIRKNPESYTLWKELTFFHYFTEKNDKKAYSSGKTAFKFITDADLNEDDALVFIRTLGRTSFKFKKYGEAQKYYSILKRRKHLNSKDKNEMNKIMEVINDKKAGH